MSTPPKWYTIIAVVALLWNLLGTIAVLADVMITPDDLARLSPDQQALYASRTWWSTTASMTAVLGGTLGSLGLVLRRHWAMPFLAASLIGLIIQDIGLFVLADGFRLAGPIPVVLQAVVLLIALALVIMAQTGSQRGWITAKVSQNG